MVCPDPWISGYGSGWLYCSALQFLPPAPEVLAEIAEKEINNNFLQCMLSPYSLIRAFTQCHSK